MRRTWSLLWAARFVSRWEGFLPTAYLDTIAYPAVYTIGFGHTGPIRDRASRKLRAIRAGDTISKAYALRLLAKDLRVAAQAVNRAVHVKLTVRQRMALISLAFNIGGWAFASSTLVKELNRGRFKTAADQFLVWNKAGSPPREVWGLTRRRRAERWMFLHSNRKH
jgi:lysozyme